MNTIKKIIFLLLTVLSISACLKEESINLTYKGYTPIFRNDGWDLSSPEVENMDHYILDGLYRDFYNGSKYPTINSLLIIRNGKLVAEAYCKNESGIDQLHNTMSATKSITSILAGIALDMNLLNSIESPVYTYLAQYFDEDIRKRSITIRQALSMETGLDFDNNMHTSDLISGKGSSLEQVLSKDLIFTPGTSWFYGDGNPQLISGIIHQVSGKSLAEFANEYLFDPLGINVYKWESHSDGLNFGAIGLWLSPRDMAKIGWLMACNGKWNGNSIVSDAWVVASTQRQSEHQNYGYYWYPIDDKAFYAEGHGGQLIWVYPEKELVVVITSDPYTKSYNISAGYEGLFEEIIYSLKD
jgi:CubicO group peptidase (beta-lactamase class C family)